MITDLERFEKYYSETYHDLYVNDKSFNKSEKACAKFESLFKKDEAFTDLAIKFMKYRGDALTSDRELAAFYLAYQKYKKIQDMADKILKDPKFIREQEEVNAKIADLLINSMKGKKTRAPKKQCPVKVDFRKML